MAILLIDDGMKMDQLRLKDLQPGLQLLQLMLEFTFDLWRLACLIADVNVHVCLGLGRRSRKKVRRPSLCWEFYTCELRRNQNFPRCIDEKNLRKRNYLLLEIFSERGCCWIALAGNCHDCHNCQNCHN